MNLRVLVALLALLALPVMGCGWAYDTEDDDEDDEPPYTSYCSADPSSCGEGEPRYPADAAVGDAAADGDAESAAYPAIDSTTGTADVTGCAADAGLAYVMSQRNELSIFDPSTFTTRTLGVVDCEVGGWPVAMTASRTGMLYVLYEDGNLWALDPSSRACARTPWFDGSDDIYDVSVAIQRTNGVEALSVLTDAANHVGGKTLSRADLPTTTSAVVGNLEVLDTPSSDLVGDAYNRLFVLTGPHVMSLDPATGAVLGVDAIPSYASSEQTQQLTGMVIGQNVYELAIHTSGATVYRYDLRSKQTTAVVQLEADVAVAAALPCTP